MDEFEAKWEVDDGYRGGSRPQTTQIHPDCVDDDMTKDDLIELFSELIQDSFDNKIAPCWKESEEQRFVDWAQKIQSKVSEE